MHSPQSPSPKTLLPSSIYSGVLVVDKPEGITTFDIIRKVKKIFYSMGYSKKELPKIGHAGTLDPFATGIVLVLIGKATKLSQELMAREKTYEGRIRFGEKTTTGDRMGETTLRVPLPHSVKKYWTEIHTTFCTHEYWQEPPMYSAKKIKGQKLYELARKGIEIEREKKLKKIFSLELLHEEIKTDDALCSEILFRTEVESGTYVRTLAEDLSQLIHTTGHLTELRRIKSGFYDIGQAVPLDILQPENIKEYIRSDFKIPLTQIK